MQLILIHFVSSQINPQYMQYIILTFKEKQIQIKWNCDIDVTIVR